MDVQRGRVQAVAVHCNHSTHDCFPTAAVNNAYVQNT
jgi:hypothetical protein